VAAVLIAALGFVGCDLIWTPPEDYRAGENWQKGTPFGLLAVLASHPGTGYLVTDPLADWVEESHLAPLMKLIESDRPCAAVILSEVANPPMPPSFSTIGNEAAYLVEGFRTGRYPPRESSVMPPPDVEEIRAWWEARKSE